MNNKMSNAPYPQWRAEMFLSGRFRIPHNMTSDEFTHSMNQQYLSLPEGKPKDYYQEEGGGVTDMQYEFPNAITTTRSQIQSTSTLGKPRKLFPHPNNAKIKDIKN